jgi:hypothetical protein
MLPVVGPVLGAAFAIPVSRMTPKMQNLGMPEATLIEDRLYLKGYTTQARAIKAQHIWLNYGIGFMLCAGIMLLNESVESPFLGFTLSK